MGAGVEQPCSNISSRTSKFKEDMDVGLEMTILAFFKSEVELESSSELPRFRAVAFAPLGVRSSEHGWKKKESISFDMDEI